MARSTWMDLFRRTVAVSRFADQRGLGSKEALEQLRDEGQRRREGRASRRELLRSAGAAALGGLVVPRVAGAAKPSSSTASIAIVGAGTGGLACAYELVAKGVAADVYEASDRVGGRVRSIGGAFGGPLDTGAQVLEQGAEFIDTAHKTMLGYATELGLVKEDVLKTPGDTLYWVDGQLHDESVVVDEYRDFVEAMRDDLGTMSAQGPLPDAYSDGDLVLDWTSLEEYLETRGAGDVLKGVITESYRGEYGCELSQQTSLNLLLFIHADRRKNWRPYGVFSDERYRIVGGTNQIHEGLAAAVAPSIRHGHRLTAVGRAPDGRYRLTFDQASGPTLEVDYDYVVFALPFSVLREVDIDDAAVGIPAWKRQAIDETQYGTNSKMHVAFDARPWIAQGSSSYLFADGLANLESAWECDTANATDTATFMTDYSSGIRGASRDESRASAEAEAWLADLDRVVPGSAAAARRSRRKVVAATRNWSQDPNARGSFVCNQVGYFTTIADFEGARVDNLLWVGEHADSWYEYQGWMEGAASSGVRAAGEILTDLRVP
ncbi:MAG: FAD-dependent oxidoreductase [Myxococcota bacterium]